MGWMKIAGFVIVLGLLAACDLDAKTPNQCQTDDQCREGAYCDVGRALCVTACEKVGCLEGHFCDPSAHTCGTECSFGCTAPENATAICRAECGYTCNSGSHLCSDRCALNTDASACGTSCLDCTGTGTVTGMICSEGACVQYDRLSRNTSVPDQPTVRDIGDPSLPLVWQGCAAGLSSNDCAGTAIPKNWADADVYCTNLNTQNWGGYTTGWRLPTEDPTDPAIVDELSSILAATCPASPSQGNACIDNSAFPNTPADFFWSSSSSSSAPDPNYAWSVSFGYGFVNFYLKSSPYYVRCVRSGP